MSTYRRGSPTLEWGSIGTEAQASIVDEWFAGWLNPNEAEITQRPYPPMHGDEPEPPNPYYHYIRDHIRTRIA